MQQIFAMKREKVMDALRLLTKEDVITEVVRGQYTFGEIGAKPVVGYKDEPGIEASSTNDTFIAARLWIDDEFWKDVPFYIRTGKKECMRNLQRSSLNSKKSAKRFVCARRQGNCSESFGD
ncbi:hypothetical protein GCM10020331_070190 [Ectobacillus funiculus]